MKKLVIVGVVAFIAWKMGYIPTEKREVTAPCCSCTNCTCPEGQCECRPCVDGKCYPCKCKGCKVVKGALVQDVVNGPEHEGREISTDLPVSQHLKNKGGSNGVGLCVFTSIDHAARWQNVTELVGFRDYMTHYPGGGYPQKVDQYIPKKAGGKDVEYVQFTDGNPEPLYLALHTGRMPCITYGYSPRYGQNIAHMVNLVYLDEKWACILDNNFPGTYEWVEHKEFIRRWNLGGGGWSVVLLNPSAPPVPHN